MTLLSMHHDVIRSDIIMQGLLKPCNYVSLIIRKGKFSNFFVREKVTLKDHLLREKGTNFWATDEDVASFSGSYTRLKKI